MEDDFKKNIAQMEGFLSRNVIKKDPINPQGASVAHLERMATSQVRDSKIVQESQIQYPSQGEDYRKIINNYEYAQDLAKALEEGFMSSFSDHQRKLVIQLIKVIIMLRSVKAEDIETTTIGILEEMGFMTSKGLKKNTGGVVSIESQTSEIEYQHDQFAIQTVIYFFIIIIVRIKPFKEHNAKIG